MKKLIYLFFAVLFSSAIVSCEEDRLFYDDEPLLTLSDTEGTYFVEEDTQMYNLTVFLLRPTNTDVDVTLNVIEEGSTAELGTDFEILEQTITIPAGAVSADFEILGDFAAASTTGKNVKFELSSSDLGLADFRNSFELNLKKACPITELLGDFNVASDFWGDFTTEVVAGQNPNELILKDYYTAGRDITIIVNEDFTVTVPKQVAWVSGQYGDASLQSSGNTSAVDPCNGIITLRLSHTVAAGSFGTETDVLTIQVDGGDGGDTDGDDSDV